MKLDDLARHARANLHDAARSMPVRLIERVSRTHAVMRLVPAMAAVTVAVITVALLAVPGPSDRPVIESPETTVPSRTDTTEAIEASFTIERSYVLDASDLEAFEFRTDVQWATDWGSGPAEVGDDPAPCCVAAGGDGAVYVVDGANRRIMQVTDGSFRVFARFDGVPVAVAAAGDRVVVGLGSNDGAVVAILDSSGSTVAQVDSVESDGPPLLTVADGRVWIGVTGTLPVDAGFAERQWFLVSDLDGEPYDTPTRSEGMPLDGGRAFHVTDTGVTLYDEENTGTEWTIGGGGTITSAHPFLDGVLVTWTTDDDASAGTSYAAYLTKDGQATGIEYARTGFAARAPEQSIDVGPQGLVTIDGTADDVRVSILSLEGLEPLGPMSIGGLDWIRAVYPSGVFGSDGRRLTRTSPVLHSVKSAAWDGDEGIVMIDPEGRLLRIHPGGEDVIAELPDDLQELVAVVDVDGRSIAGYTRLEGNATTITWIDITTGEPADGPGDRVVLRGDGRIELAAQGRRARIDHPDWSGVPRGEGGEPVPPFPLPELVITDDAGTELLRLPIGSEQRPLAVLHDFDGRRVIVSAEPWEPAAAPRTVWIVDLECVACTQTVDAGPDSFDLIGIATSEGPIDAFEPLVPSETG